MNGQQPALIESRFLLKDGLEFFQSTGRQVSEWLLVQLRTAAGTFELLAIKPSECFRKLLATAEAVSRQADFSHASLRVSERFSSGIDISHKLLTLSCA